MNEFFLPYFDKIDLHHLKKRYNVPVKINGDTVEISLNFESTILEEPQMIVVEYFLNNLEKYYKENKDYLKNDFNDTDGDGVRDFLEFHVEEYGEDILLDLIDFESEVFPEEQLLSRMKLIKINLFPDEESDCSSFAVFNYVIDKCDSEQLLVVNIDEEGALDHIAWES